MEATDGRDIAVDVHRRSRYVVIATRTGTVLARRRYGVDAAETEALLAQIQPGDRVILEATGGTHYLADRLEARGAEVFVVDPQHARLVGFRGKKTDYRDCLALLEHLRRGDLVLVWRPNGLIRDLRQLTRERFAFNQSIVRLKNRIQHVLGEAGYVVVGELFSPAGEQWWRGLTLRPTTRAILSREWAALQALETGKAEEKEMLAQFALELPLAQRLMQLPGFGVDLAVMWVGEVGDPGRFPNYRKLTSYAGFNPRVHDSGERQRGGGITKAGRSQLRWIMVEVAQRHVAADGPEAGYYHRLVAAGKPAAVAMVALAHRLLRLAYLLVTRETLHRGVDLRKYESKLAELAAHRPHVEPADLAPGAEPQPCNRDWAADRVEALTGQPSPRRRAGVPRKARPAPRRRRSAPEAAGAPRPETPPPAREWGRPPAPSSPAEAPELTSGGRQAPPL